MYTCHLFLIASASVRSRPFLSFIEPILGEISLGISNFLEEISSLSHSVVFLYFFALIAEEGFLIYPCYSLELCIQRVYLSFSPLPFSSFLSCLQGFITQPFCLFAFLFLGDGFNHHLLYNVTNYGRMSVDGSSGTLSDLVP